MPAPNPAAPPDPLAARFRAHLERRRLFAPPGRAVLAVSGGADSLALLDLMAGAAPALGLELVVAHADHGIHPASAAVADAVAAAAARYGLPCERTRLALGARATETGARRARYAWLAEVRARHGGRWLVTAHHRDDQIETVLLRVLRGSGPAGLAGMAARTRGGLVRPLLPFTRAELAAHTASLGLAAHDDPANRDPRHLRSWVRVELLPLLVERLGGRVEDDLLRLARAAAVDRRAWARLPDLLPELAARREAAGFSVARDPLARYDPAVGIAVLRALARGAGLVLGYAPARRVLALAAGSSGRRVTLPGGWTAGAAFDRLTVQGPARAAAPPEPIAAEGAAGAGRFGRFEFAWAPAAAPERLAREGWTTWLAAPGWRVRAPRPGDRIRPLGGVGRRELRRVLMEARVPRAARAAWPVVARGETILWVPGICRGADEIPAPGTAAVRVDVTGGEAV